MIPTTKGKTVPRLNTLLFAMMMEDLADGPCRLQDLCDHTGLSIKTVRPLMNELHKRGVVYISGWERDNAGRMMIRVFSLGRRKDVEKQKKPKHAVQKEWRARQRAKKNHFASLMAANDPARRAA